MKVFGLEQWAAGWISHPPRGRVRDRVSGEEGRRKMEYSYLECRATGEVMVGGAERMRRGSRTLKAR